MGQQIGNRINDVLGQFRPGRRPKRYRIVIDRRSGRPADLVTQLMLGGEEQALRRFFPEALWLSGTSPFCAPVSGTDAQWEEHVRRISGS